MGVGGMPGTAGALSPPWLDGKSITVCQSFVTLTLGASHLLPFGERLVFLCAKTSCAPCLISQKGSQGIVFFLPAFDTIIW